MQEKVMGIGSVTTAFLASLCCVGPALFAVAGVGGLGVLTFFEPYRLYLIGTTVLLLAAGFYFTYRKKQVQCEDGTCRIETAGKWNKISLWLATGIAVFFITFPYTNTVFLEASPKIQKAIEQDASCPTCGKAKPCEHNNSTPNISRSCCALDAAPVPAADQELGEISVATLKKEFNAASDVRFISILSPNCPVCQKGKGVIKSIFEQHQTDGLKGLVVWLPMWGGDRPATAYTQANTLTDARIIKGWDGNQQIGSLFAESRV